MKERLSGSSSLWGASAPRCQCLRAACDQLSPLGAALKSTGGAGELTFFSFGTFHEMDQQEEIKTIFISGLPEDVKAREIYALLHTFDGFEGVNMRDVGKLVWTAAFFTRGGSLSPD